MRFSLTSSATAAFVTAFAMWMAARPAAAQVYPVPQGGTFPSTYYNFGATAPGDVNGDGILDVVFTAYAPGNNNNPVVATMLGSSTGSYTASAPTATTCTSAPASLITADLNGDKKLDVVFTCGSYVVVLLGNGDGTFASPTYVAVSGLVTGLSPIAVTDLNRDGYLEILATTSSGLAVLTSQGSSSPGTYTVSHLYAEPWVSGQVFAGDFNGDGKQDALIVGSGTTGPLAVFSGNGDGTLATPTVIHVNATIATIAVADLNHDGKSDIVWSSGGALSTASIRTLLGGSGGLTAGPTFTFPASTGPSVLNSVAIAETRNAGNNTDLFLFTSPEGGGSTITTVLLGDGAGGFTLGRSYAFSGGLAAQTTAGATLFSGPIASTVTSGYGFRVLQGNGDGTFRGLPATYLGTYATPATADFNSDGLLDVLTADAAGNLEALLAQGNGFFAQVSSTAAVATAAGSGAALMAADLNSDGKADAIQIFGGVGVGHGSTVYQSAQVYVSLGNGDGTFGVASAPINLNVIGARQGYVGDFNGDGKPDLLIPYVDFYDGGAGVVLLLGNGDGTFSAPVTVATTAVANSFIPAVVGDINHDGKTDFVWNGSVFLGNSSGTFTMQPLGLLGTPLLLQDMNGDGYADLFLFPADASARVKIYAGRSDGTFNLTPYFATQASGGSAAPVIAGYANGDSTLDFAQIGDEGDTELILYDGIGGGTFALDTNYYGAGQEDSELNGGTFGRLNSAAPALGSDKSLDALVFHFASVTTLLNSNYQSYSSATATALNVTPSPAAIYQTVTLTATVSPVATGTVTFSTPAGTLGTAGLNSSGVATLTTQFSTIGTFPITATYGGDAAHLSSVSPAVNEVVRLTSTTTLSATPTNPSTSQSVTFTAKVTAGLTPTGTVTFSTTSGTLGTAAVDGTGTAKLTQTFSTAGAYIVTAAYGGDSNDLASSSAPVTVNVAAPTTTMLTSSLGTAGTGQQITLTATVAGAGATGSVTFATPSATLGVGVLNGSGVATLTTSFASAGTYAITASYAGDPLHVASTSAAVSVVVVSPDFSITANPTALTIARGQSGQATITLTPVGGFSGTIGLTCGTVPSETTCTFSPASLIATGTGPVSSTLTFGTTAPQTRSGGAQGAGLWAGALLSLFGLLTLRRRKLLAGMAIALTMTVVLGMTACSSGTKAPSNPGTPQGTSTVTVTAAVSGGTTHTLNVQVTIQ